MKQQMLDILREHALIHIKKHRLNVEVYLNNAVGVADHASIMDSIEKELEEMARYHDQIEIIDRYFPTE